MTESTPVPEVSVQKKFPTLKHYVYGAVLAAVAIGTAYVARSELFASKEDPETDVTLVMPDAS